MPIDSKAKDIAWQLVHGDPGNKINVMLGKGAFTYDGRCFWGIFDLPTYLVLPYNVRFWGLSWTLLPTLISDVINGRSPS